ncbi:MAG: hypothetical protein JW715_09275 [Sedimentisphaerales bacterium]|nr:hypothetical protein [Sedimentisphaerales bacterium]
MGLIETKEKDFINMFVSALKDPDSFSRSEAVNKLLICHFRTYQSLRALYELLRDLRDKSGNTHKFTKNAIEYLQAESDHSSKGYPALWDLFAKPEVIADIEQWGNTIIIKPIEAEGLWVSKYLSYLKKIDSTVRRDGIPGDKKTLKRLKEYLTRRRKRPDIAGTLYYEEGKIKTKMPYRSMFKEI